MNIKVLIIGFILSLLIISPNTKAIQDDKEKDTLKLTASNYDSSKDDKTAYDAGYNAAAQKIGYDNVPPNSYTTEESKQKYLISYHKGYFNAIAESSRNEVDQQLTKP